MFRELEWGVGFLVYMLVIGDMHIPVGAEALSPDKLLSLIEEGFRGMWWCLLGILLERKF